MRFFICAVGLGFFGALKGQTDTIQKWKFGMFADFYAGRSLLLSENSEIGLDDLVSHQRLGELSLNTAIVTADYSDTRVRFSGGIGSGSYFLKNLANEPLGYRNIFQCYGGLKLSEAGSVWMDVGIMPSHIGYESAISMDQPTLTRSLVSDFSPYYETGIKFSGQLKRFTFSSFLLNGWQRMWRLPNDNSAHIGSQVNYQGENLIINYSGYYGGLGQDNNSQLRVFHNVYANYNLSERYKLWLLLDIGKDNSGINSKDWWGSAAILQYKLNNKFSIASRLERFKDLHNRIVVSATKPVDLTGFSINVDYNFSKNVLIRMEWKQYNSVEPIFYDQSAISFSKKSIIAIASFAWKITN